jgi:hypothetical protein
MTEEQEIAEYRAQVREYLETGKSDTLSDSDKLDLDRRRKEQANTPTQEVGWFKRVFSFG